MPPNLKLIDGAVPQQIHSGQQQGLELSPEAGALRVLARASAAAAPGGRCGDQGGPLRRIPAGPGGVVGAFGCAPGAALPLQQDQGLQQVALRLFQQGAGLLVRQIRFFPQPLHLFQRDRHRVHILSPVVL